MTRIRKSLREEHKDAIKWAWRKMHYKLWHDFWRYEGFEKNLIPPNFSRDNYAKYEKSIIAFFDAITPKEWENEINEGC